MNGASALGDFHYEPVMFSEARRVRKAERHLLAVAALLLSRVQGTLPSRGILYLGRDSAMTSIRFGPSLPAAEDLLRDAERLQRAGTQPKLMLNNHCRICEFRDRCRAQAISEENLSLLRGIGEKTVKKYSQEGSTNADPTCSYIPASPARQAVGQAAQAARSCPPCSGHTRQDNLRIGQA